ncbi:MAG: tyrosine--tRNA ligase [Gemmatimonadaceae bacterium]|nr:tyrosine--tRNA ligase [Gemmatimonadaceae bacterium]
MVSFLAELDARGLLHQTTEGAADHLAKGPVAAYCGFDPTADSLHVGHLLPVMTLVHLQRHGHRPVALVGGGTGMIGDPSGKAAERQLLDAGTVAANTRALRAQLERFLDFSGPAAARIVDNHEWLGPMALLDFLRDVGKHFSVNVMLQKESVKQRMETGISFTEFSYQLLQAYDFLQLHERHGVTLQVGGSDQFGNITAGTDLIRRVARAEAHGITVPLVTTAAGTKFGKTEAGAVWLDARRTSPYAFYQFWKNAADADAVRWLDAFTLLDATQRADARDALAANPATRAAQTLLAQDVTRRVHGAEALRSAELVSGFLFGGVAPQSLDTAALSVLAREVPSAEIRPVHDGEHAGRLDVYDMLVATKLADSNGAAKRLMQQGGVSVNKEKLGADARFLDASAVQLADGWVVVGKGKRDYGVVRVLS